MLICPEPRLSTFQIMNQILDVAVEVLYRVFEQCNALHKALNKSQRNFELVEIEQSEKFFSKLLTKPLRCRIAVVAS